MLMDLKTLLDKYKIEVNGVLHCGGHFGQEYEQYISYGAKNIIFIEPCADAFSKLKEKFSNNDMVKLFNFAAADFTGTQEMFTSKNNEGQSNSLMEPSLHKKQHPDIVFDTKELVTVRRIDDVTDINRELYNVMCIDCQGAEGLVISGAKDLLKGIDVIYTEVNRKELYKGNILIDDLDILLSDFRRVGVEWASERVDWGDACYISKRALGESIEEVSIEKGNTQVTSEPSKMTSESESFFKESYPAIHKNNPTLTVDICNLMEAYAKDKVGRTLESVKEEVKNKFRFDISHAISLYK